MIRVALFNAFFRFLPQMLVSKLIEPKYLTLLSRSMKLAKEPKEGHFGSIRGLLRSDPPRYQGGKTCRSRSK